MALPLAIVAVAAEQMKLLPVDEASAEPGFAAFRAELIKAVEKRDAGFVRAIVSPDIELSTEDQGMEDFERIWSPDDPDSDLWGELGDILALGGSWNNHRQFCAPYVASKWPARVNENDYLAVTARNVNLRTDCARTAPVVAVLSYDLVAWAENPAKSASAAAPQTNAEHAVIYKGEEGWIKVRTVTGKKGCLLEQYVRSPLDYRACFEKIKGKWMMTVLAAKE